MKSSNNKINIMIQRLSKDQNIPEDKLLKRWIKTALKYQAISQAEITVRITGKRESATLNQQYRNKTGPTNILSFGYQAPDPLMGDMVICAPLVREEARAQKKATDFHWAHLIIHGCLHLLGHDHHKMRETKIMQALEIKILHTLKFANPYQ